MKSLISLFFLLVLMSVESQSADRGGPLPADPKLPSFHGDLNFRYRTSTSGKKFFLGNSTAKVKKAAEITAAAQMSIMHNLRSGLKEGDLKTLIDQSFLENNVKDLAFDHIVGSGPNSTEIHYSGSSRILRDGDVVVVDIGAKYEGYCGDITRTYPVSGTFSERQHQIYQLVLDTQKATAAYAIPGKTTMNELTSFARAFFKASPLTAVGNDGIQHTMDAFFTHSVGHYLGQKVHAPGDYSRPIPLDQPFTIEPGLYIRNEEIGVRIEDDYVMTPEGARNLWDALPSDPWVIEEIIHSSFNLGLIISL